VQLTHLDEECEAQRIEPIRSIHASCSQRIIELNHMLRTQLDNNEPRDVKLLGTGKLKSNSTRKPYGNRSLIQSHSTLVSNHTSKDVIPPMSVEYDCCGGVDKNFTLNELHLHIPLRSVANSLDLRTASHKVEDVENSILEQDWKIKHSTVDSHLSFLSYVGMVTTTSSLTLICLCYCCCSKCCSKQRPKFSKWWNDNNPCTTIVFKPKIVNSIHSSIESEDV
jgi:hypothetical protein